MTVYNEIFKQRDLDFKKRILGKNDPYLDEIVDTQGQLFENAVLLKYDYIDFVNKYMKSEFRAYLDIREPVRSNMLWPEQLEWILKETKIKKHREVKFDYMLANWLGEFYGLMQYKTQIPSYELVQILAPAKLATAALGMHDLDMQLAIDRVINTQKGKLQYYRK